MISVTGKKWVEHKININSVEKIKQDFKFSDLLSKLIFLRNFDISEITHINNNLGITNIFKNNDDYLNASKILDNTISKKEKICILGDYDVDGSAATSLLVRFFKHIKHPHFYYIPDREKDGYGATKKLFQKLILQNPKLVIMVDCGSTSNEAIDFLNDNNIKSIIIDHHEINKPFPKSNIIINPKKNYNNNEYDYLCATALTYFFIDYFIKKKDLDFKLSDLLIYVLFATICDVMPLRKINKIIASNVFKNFNINKNKAFAFIYDYLGLKKKLTTDDLGYLFGPIINSGGRLGYSMYGAELLISDNLKVIKKRSIELINLNNRRKKIEEIILNKIDFKKIKKENKNVIIYYSSDINEGLIGIIAARLKDYFNKPVIVLTKSNDFLKGSARSTPDYNIGNIIKLLLDNKIIESGGGHNMAAGLVVKHKNIKLLDNFVQKDFLKKNLVPNLLFKYDSEISSSAINDKVISEINKLGPFGSDNLLPIFLIKDVKIIKSRKINNKHISSIIKPNLGPSFQTICFNSVNSEIGEYLLSYKKRINIITIMNENIWNNKKTIQLNIKDLILSVN